MAKKLLLDDHIYMTAKTYDNIFRKHRGLLSEDMQSLIGNKVIIYDGRGPLTRQSFEVQETYKNDKLGS